MLKTRIRFLYGDSMYFKKYTKKHIPLKILLFFKQWTDEQPSLNKRPSGIHVCFFCENHKIRKISLVNNISKTFNSFSCNNEHI